jgi:hypothetical protein
MAQYQPALQPDFSRQPGTRQVEAGETVAGDVQLIGHARRDRVQARIEDMQLRIVDGVACIMLTS